MCNEGGGRDRTKEYVAKSFLKKDFNIHAFHDNQGIPTKMKFCYFFAVIIIVGVLSRSLHASTIFFIML